MTPSSPLARSAKQWLRSTWAANRRYRLHGKSVLITGGSRGLGIALARELSSRGAHIAIAARDEHELERARVDLESYSARRVLMVRCDVTDPAQIEKAVVEVLAAHERIDILVNVAGIIEVGPLAAMDVADFERAMATNFWGPLHFMRAVTPGMIANGGGRIANVSSVGGLVAVPHLLPYVASKFALTGFSLGARAELAKDRIGVSTICPGLMRTGSPPNATFKGDRAAEYAWFASGDSTPLLSTSAEAAARRIVRAIVRNEAMVRIGLPAQLAAIAAAVVPDLVSGVMTFANALLPSGSDPTPAIGAESASATMPKWLTALSDRASARNNEYGAATH